MIMVAFTVLISKIDASLAKNERTSKELFSIDIDANNELDAVHKVSVLKRDETYPLLRNESTVISYKIAHEVKDDTQNS